MSMMVSFVLSFFPRDVLDEILNLIESASEDFPSYSYINFSASASSYLPCSVLLNAKCVDQMNGRLIPRSKHTSKLISIYTILEKEQSLTTGKKSMHTKNHSRPLT